MISFAARLFIVVCSSGVAKRKTYPIEEVLLMFAPECLRNSQDFLLILIIYPWSFKSSGSLMFSHIIYAIYFYSNILILFRIEDE